MKQKLFTLFIVILLFLGQGINVYSQHTVTIKSQHFSFTLSYPYDWHCEHEHGLPKNIQAILTPQAFLLDSSPATVYVRVVPRTPKSPSLKQFIKNDFQNVKKHRPHIQYGTDFTLMTKDHKVAQIRTYFEEPQNLYDAIAYIAEKNSFVIIILQTVSQKAYLRALPTFRNLVTSYQLERPQEKAPSPPTKKRKLPSKKKKSKRKFPRKSLDQPMQC
jgi:hypothetical protein